MMMMKMLMNTQQTHAHSNSEKLAKTKLLSVELAGKVECWLQNSELHTAFLPFIKWVFHKKVHFHNRLCVFARLFLLCSFVFAQAILTKILSNNDQHCSSSTALLPPFSSKSKGKLQKRLSSSFGRRRLCLIISFNFVMSIFFEWKRKGE